MNPFELAEKSLNGQTPQPASVAQQSPQSQQAQGSEVNLPPDLIAEIKRRATDEALRGLKDLWKREIEKVYEDFDASSYRNFRDAIRALGDFVASKMNSQNNQVQTLPQQSSVVPSQNQNQTQSSVDVERLRAQIRAELEEQYKQERKNLLVNSAYETLASYALSKGLNPKYKDLFAVVLKSSYLIDYDDEDRLVYRKPDTKELILEKGNNPSLEFLISPFLQTHSELFSAPKSGAGVSGGLPSSGSENKTIRHDSVPAKSIDTISMIDAALKGG